MPIQNTPPAPSVQPTSKVTAASVAGLIGGPLSLWLVSFIHLQNEAYQAVVKGLVALAITGLLVFLAGWLKREKVISETVFQDFVGDSYVAPAALPAQAIAVVEHAVADAPAVVHAVADAPNAPATSAPLVSDAPSVAVAAPVGDAQPQEAPVVANAPYSE